MQQVIDNNMLISYFKHNNASYLQQGGVSSSSRIQRLKYNTLYAKIPSNATNKPIIFNDKPVNTNYKTPEGTRNNFKPRYNPACQINKLVPMDYDPNAVCRFQPKNKFELKYAISEYLKGTIKYGNINDWDTSLIIDMSELFLNNEKFNYDISRWNITNVTNMKSMFSGAINFDKKLSSWDVSGVLDMNSMFKNAINFDQDISKWDTVSVLDMTSMFENATNFDKNIRYWRVESKTVLTNMFLDSTSMINKYSDVSTFGTTPNIMFFNYIDDKNKLYPPMAPPSIKIPYPPFSGPPIIITSSNEPQAEPEAQPESIIPPDETISADLLCKCDDMEFDENDTTDYSRLPLQVNSLYHNVGYEIYGLINQVINDKEGIDFFDYSSYSRLSKLLLDEECERFEGYESLRMIIVRTLELMLKSKNSEQNLEDKVKSLEERIMKMFKEGYVKKNPLDITQGTLTVGIPRPEYQLYINIYGKPNNNVFDPVKLAEIVKILEENNIETIQDIENVESIKTLDDLNNVNVIS
tara:strand:- start:541 stop:2112 length:1572 start_codon:yes stop_codon:yes gene_type:complete